MAENREKVRGPHSGRFALIAVLLGTAATWGLIYFLHVKNFRDPLNPLTPSSPPPAAEH